MKKSFDNDTQLLMSEKVSGQYKNALPIYNYPHKFPIHRIASTSVRINQEFEKKVSDEIKFLVLLLTSTAKCNY